VENGDYSSVYRQPATETEQYQAYQALLACPVGSIGAVAPDKAYLRAATDSFPMLIEHNVYYNGFNSEKSFGANSYFIRHPGGSMALLCNDRYLFTGDHLSWDREDNGLRMATVYVWKESALRRSTEGLLNFSFEWVLPGHGDRIHLPAARMKEELRLLLARR